MNSTIAVFPAVTPGFRLVPATIGRPGEGWTVGSVLSPGETVHELYVRVHSDPSHPERQLRTAHVLLGNGAPFDSYLTPDDADQAADELAAFAAKIREAARTARLANTASGDSDPDMDEALRRVRGGAA